MPCSAYVDADFSTIISPDVSRSDDILRKARAHKLLRHLGWEMRRKVHKDARRLLSQASAPIQQSLVRISRGTFFRQHPSTVQDPAKNPPLFPNLTFDIQSRPWAEKSSQERSQHDEHWAVISARGGTSFLEILRGSHFCEPIDARSFPYLASDDIPQEHNSLRLPAQAIRYVGFNPGKGSNSLGAGVKGAYLSARYESRRLTAEETDWTVRQYLTGQTEQNPNEDLRELVDDAALSKTVVDLRLEKLLDMPVSNLSNGQTRRARIAKALLEKPLLLLLDDPFMGLDPPTLVRLSPMLRNLARDASPLLLLALRSQDPIPDWITHLVILGDDHQVSLMGPKDGVLLGQHAWSKYHHHPQPLKKGRTPTGTLIANEMTNFYGPPLQGLNEVLTQHGVYQDDTYERMLASGNVYDGFGILRRSSVPKDLKTVFEKSRDTCNSLQPAKRDDPEARARSEQPHTEMLESLKLLITTVPRQLEKFKATNEHQTSQQLIDTSEASSIKRGLGLPLIELQSVVIKYGDKVVLGHPPPQPGHEAPGLNITISEGTRLALLGPNGSGKTTFLSLLTSDHPQSYSLPIKFFGRSRLPEPGKPGLSMWEIQSRVGHSSPEVHSFFPKHLNIRQVLESAWAETYISKPKLSHERDETVDAFLRWWEPELRQDFSATLDNVDQIKKASGQASEGIRSLVESVYPPLITPQRQWAQTFNEDDEPNVETSLDWAEDDSMSRFGVLPFGVQRLLLLLRALIKKPDVLILDEAFSGLSPEVRDKAMCFLEYGERKFLFDMSELDIIRHSYSRQPPREEGVSEDVPRLWDNTRLAVRDIVAKYNVDLARVIQNRDRQKSSLYSNLRNKTKEQLVQEAEEYALEYPQTDATPSWLGKEKLQPYRFEGLTDKQAMVVVSHIKEEVPELCDEFVRLPGEEEVLEEGMGVETGYVGRGGIRERWGWVWRLRETLKIR